jgi:hypothetical protein
VPGTAFIYTALGVYPQGRPRCPSHGVSTFTGGHAALPYPIHTLNVSRALSGAPGRGGMGGRDNPGGMFLDWGFKGTRIPAGGSAAVFPSSQPPAKEGRAIAL